MKGHLISCWEYILREQNEAYPCSNLLQPKCYTSSIILDHASYFSSFNHCIEDHLPWFRPLKLDSIWFLPPNNTFKSGTSAYHLWGSNFFEHPAESYSLMLSMLQSLLLTMVFLWFFCGGRGEGRGVGCWWFSIWFVQLDFFFFI